MTLKLLIFLLIVAGVLIALGAVWLDRRLFRRHPLARLEWDSAELDRILNAAPFGLLILEQTQTVAYSNAYARRLLGLSSDSGTLSDQLQQDLAAWKAESSDSGALEPRYRVINLPSQQTLSWWIGEMENQTVVVLNDLTPQRQREQAVQMVGGNLSHELRTPLTSILAHLEVVRSAELAAEVRSNSLDIIHQQTTRLVRLVQGWLELGKLESVGLLERRAVNLRLIAEEAMADLIMMGEEKRIALALDAPSNLPNVWANSDRLKQVLVNLIDNAIKYCYPGDQVTVLIRPHEDGVCLEVRDSGPGIAASDIPHLTEQFYRGRNDVVGSGLGLPLVAEILRRHDSRLEVESNDTGDSTGTTMRFVLPTIGD